jgi:hypothetical protein
MRIRATSWLLDKVATIWSLLNEEFWALDSAERDRVRSTASRPLAPA